MVTCREQVADLHIAQLMPLPVTVSCFSKIQIGFTFLVAAHPGSPGKRAIKRVYVYLYDAKVKLQAGGKPELENASVWACIHKQTNGQPDL